MKTQSEKLNILVLALTINMNTFTGDGNTFINHSELNDSNNTHQAKNTTSQDLKPIIIILQEELAQLQQILIYKEQALMEKDKLIQLLILRDKKE
jgi:hypothetical protein